MASYVTQSGRYRTTGTMDDPTQVFGDTFLTKMVTRLHPSQLQPGEVALSENGRMETDGNWQPRKGVETIHGEISSGATTLTLPFTLPSVGELGDLTTAYLSDGDVSRIYGSCVYSDPKQSNKEYILLATNLDCRVVDLATPATTYDVTYPSSIKLTTECNMVQYNDKVYLFRDQYTAFEWDGDTGGSLAFTAVADGTYTQPVFTTDANCDATNGIVTFAWTSHGLPEGALVTVGSSADAELQLLAGTDLTVHVVDANNISFKADIPDFTNSSTVLIKRVSVGGGFIHQPAAPWGTPHEGRVWMPYLYSPSADETTQATTRNVTDEIIATDLFDGDTLDPLSHQFRITAGIADYTVGVHPFTNDKLLVANRNSLHLIQGTSGNLEDCVVTELTTEIGCSARKTLVTYKDQILFLSDNGVYSVEFIDEYNLRGTGLPLSEEIQPLIDDINTDYVACAAATYFNNRYYIAYPKGSSQVNNAILVYNFLNQGWESIDTFADTNFNILNFHTARSGDENKLYVVNSYGGVHLLESREDDSDQTATNMQLSEYSINLIPSAFTSRQYSSQNLEEVRFQRAYLNMKSSASNVTDASISAITENPDTDTEIDTVVGILGVELIESEDGTLPTRLGNLRGIGLQMKITPSVGRPQVRGIRVEGVSTLKSLTPVI